MIRRNFLARIASGLTGLACWPWGGATKPTRRRKRIVGWEVECVTWKATHRYRGASLGGVPILEDSKGQEAEWVITKRFSDGTTNSMITDDMEDVKWARAYQSGERSCT